MKLSSQYWDKRYQDKSTGWDIGYVSTPLKEYMDQLFDKKLKILIPGGGNSYEAEYLHANGFKNVYVIDIAKTPLENIQLRISDFPSEHLINGDFFELDMKFDLILEQTFFCALAPSFRAKYAKQMHRLLQEKGKLVGLLFDIPLTEDGPPFGGDKKEYIKCFSPYFNITKMEAAYNSIPARMGNELFFRCIKK